jgi:cytochrome c oxidase subunit III
MSEVFRATPREMGRVTAVLDVSLLPKNVWGHKSLLFWAMWGFMLIEGATTMLVVAAYFYLRRNFGSWPPPRTPLPGLIVGTLDLVVSLASIYPMYMAKLAAKRFDPRAVARWMTIGVVFGVGIMILRALEFRTVNTRWDEHAYGSVVWALLVTHLSLLILDWVESAGLAYIFASGKYVEKSFYHIEDDVSYWIFIVLLWVPLYFIIFLLPRVVPW